VPGALSPGVNRPGREADHSPLSSQGQEHVHLCILHSHSPINLRGVLLHYLSTGTVLPLSLEVNKDMPLSLLDILRSESLVHLFSVFVYPDLEHLE
jgi:hypothetical protein